MEKLRVELGDRSYDIHVGTLDDCTGLCDIGKEIKALGGFSERCAIVSNDTVFNLYGPAVSVSLRQAGFNPAEIIIPDGEQYKNLEWMDKIFSGMLSHRLDRKSFVLALGGGVVGDMTGFAAACYMRGIAFVQVPTTLLAQVDSSVGGKTGVNHPLGKNMIGAFWQPSLVWIDMDVMETLPQREYLAGLAEVLKYGVIWDSEFFTFLENERQAILAKDPSALKHVIMRSCAIKAEVVSKDEREGGLRAILNYGHTMGHAVETLTGYTKYLHGETVAVGMAFAARLSQRLGLLDAASVERIEKLITDYGLPVGVEDDLNPDEVVGAMKLDKKSVSGSIRFVLPTSIGSVKLDVAVDGEVIKEVLG